MQGVGDGTSHKKAPRIIKLSESSKPRNAEEQIRFQLDLERDASSHASAPSARAFALGEIVEKAPTSSVRPPTLPSAPAVQQKTGFPVPQARRHRLGKVREAKERQTEQDAEAEGPVAKSDIDHDSEAMLSGMSEQEILEEQEKLRAALSPDLLAFVQQRARKDHPAAPPSISGVPAPDAMSTEVHFTLSGNLVTSQTETMHGDHVHAGPSQSYTLPSLLRLARSTVSAQRTTALTVLTRVIHRHLLVKDSSAASKVITPHIEEVASIAAASLGLSERSVGVLSSAVALIHALARLPMGVSVLTKPETLLSVLGGLRRQLIDRTLKGDRLELIAETLCLLSHVDDACQPMLHQEGLLETVVELFVCVPWPPADDADGPTVFAPRLLQSIASHSRESARALLARRQDLLDPLLRFLVTKPYSGMLIETLQMWTTLVRYGLGAEMRSSPGLERHLIAIESYVGGLSAGTESDLAGAWFDLIGAWAVCAIDPHNTEPAHSIVWTQAEEWGESLRDAALASLKERVDDTQSNGALAACLGALASWLDGAALNWTSERFNAFRLTCDDLRTMASALLSDTLLSLADAHMETAASLALSCIRLMALLHVQPPLEQASDALLWLLAQPRLPRSAALLSASIAMRLKRVSMSILQAVVHRLGAGDGHSAQAVAMRMLELSGVEEGRQALLRPFVVNACLISSTVAPLRPVSATLPLVQTLRINEGDKPPLLSKSWPMSCVLQELLLSGSSDVVQSLPPEQRNEAALLEAALSAAQVVFAYKDCCPSTGEMIYELLQVFMLEKDVAETPSGPLFRQQTIANRLLALLNAHPPEPGDDLGPLALSSFPNFYEELVELYGSISLGDELFGRFLLLPLCFEGETITACARILFHSHHSLLRTISDAAVVGHPALKQKLKWADDEVVQGALKAALAGGEVRPDRNGALVQMFRLAMS